MKYMKFVITVILSFLLCGCATFFRGRGGGGCSVGRKLCKTLSFVSDDHYIGQYGYLIIVIEEARENGAFYFRFLLKRSLVGLVAEQHVSDCDFVSNFLLEFGYDTTLDRLALFGHDYDVSHLCYCFIWVHKVTIFYGNYNRPFQALFPRVSQGP